jgi:DNA polymerase III alpha subunit
MLESSSNNNFVHLHLHSDYTFCRGASSVEQICEAVRQKGMTHLALTDTNGLYILPHYIETAKSYGLKPLIGAQLQTEKNHCIMLAKGLRGYQCLCRAISRIHSEEDFDLADYLLTQRREVVLLTDDLDLLNLLHQHGSEEDVYAELVPHGNRERVLRFARQNQIPVVATNAVYFVSRQDWPVHQLLRAIDLNTTLQRIPASELASPQAFLTSPKEMSDAFPDCPEAIRNSREIAEQCTFDLKFSDFIFASFTGPQGEDAQSYLEKEVIRGVNWRYGKIDDQIRQRMDYELRLIGDKGFAPYFLVVADIVRQAPRTCGRGSAAASLVSYCLGITHVDPIKYDLFFERFLNPGRQDPPDIDVDFPWDERDDILDYIFRKYCSDCTAMIANHNLFKSRSAVREVAKVYGLPDGEIGAVSKKMSGYWQPDDLMQMTRTHPVFKNTDIREPWPEIFHQAEKIRGFPRHLSIHCGGVVIAPDGLDRYVPVQPAKKVLNLSGILRDGSSGLPSSDEVKTRVQVVQWEKDQAEDMGLIKMDILGNRSLAVIRDALAAIKKNYGIELDYAQWNPLENPETIDLLARGETIGVFYVESPAMRLLQKKTGRGDFEHLVIHSSIIRPAANAYINEYIRRLKGGSYAPLHPKLEVLLKETYGIMVYQEDVAKVSMALADFDAAEADTLRKIISKKHKQKQLEDFREKFYSNAQKNGVAPETCEKIWDMIMSFSGYSFCKPHSASYAQVSFKSAYLRVHYPAEFIAAVISNQGGYYTTFAYISEARRMGLKVLMPDVNKSEKHYYGINREVRVGLMQLKGFTSGGLETLLDERSRRSAFKSFDDFLSRTQMNPSDATILVKAGCFDSLEPKKSRPELLWRLRWHAASRNKASDRSVLPLFEEEAPSADALPQPKNYDERTILQHEVETLGFLVSRHPLTLYKDRIRKLEYVKGSDLVKHAGEKISTIGWLITGKVVSTKKEELMEFMSFEDTTAIYEVTFFPKAYAEFAHIITNTKPYILEGKVDMQYETVTLTVEKVSLL